jgi:lysophospholipase L1-like esterase
MIIQPGSTILFQGDSITDAGRMRDFNDNPIPANHDAAMGRGYAAMIAASLLADRPQDGLQFHNRGISGDRIKNMRDRWQQDCLEIKPDILSILIGINDTWHGVAKGTPEDGVGLEPFNQILRELIQTTRDTLPGTTIVLCDPFTTEAGPVLQLDFHPDIDERRAIVQEIARDEQLILVPFQAMFDKLCDQAPPAYWAGDGVHPTMAGHKMMARYWLETVLNS